MKKILFLLPIVFLFFTSCDEENNYYLDEKVEETIQFQQPTQIAEERRNEFNFKIPFESNSKNSGEVEISISDTEGNIKYSTKKVLHVESGYITTGKTHQLVANETHYIKIKNIPENGYAYNFDGSEDYENSSIVFEVIPIPGEFEFISEVTYVNQIDSNDTSATSHETISLNGGFATLISMNFYRKISDDLNPWEVISHIHIDVQNLGNIAGTDTENENDWTDSNDDYRYSSIGDLDIRFYGYDGESRMFHIVETIKPLSEEVEMEYYTEYVFEDEWGEIYTFQTESHEIDILEVNPIEDVDIDTDDIYTDESGWQRATEYFAETNTSIQTQRTDIYLDMDTSPWEVFSAVKIVNGTGDVIVYNTSLSNESEWDTLGGELYKLRLNNAFDTLGAGDDLEHTIYYILQPNLDDIDVETYVNVRYLTDAGITHYFQTDEEDFEIED